MEKIFKGLRIACCVLATVLAAACIFIFIYLGWAWGLTSLAGCAVFVILMLLFKNLQEREERKNNPPPPQGDFITGKIVPDENKQDID